MKQRYDGAMDWTPKTLFIALVASIFGLLIALALKQLGIWPRWNYSEALFGGLCGATAVYLRHRQRPLVVLFVFVPTLAAVLLAVAILFDVYVLGHAIEL